MEPTQPSRQAIHKANAQAPRWKSTTNTKIPQSILRRLRCKHYVHTNTTASSELLTMTAAVKNQTCYVKRCSVHHATSYKHWYRQAMVSLISASCDTHACERHKPKQADTTTVIPSSIHTCKHVGLNGLLSRCTWGCPFCTQSSQPCYAGFNHHAPPPALAHLPRCHLAKCQVGLKARALPHTRPPVRPTWPTASPG